MKKIKWISQNNSNSICYSNTKFGKYIIYSNFYKFNTYFINDLNTIGIEDVFYLGEYDTLKKAKRRCKNDYNNFIKYLN
jgi:hypothetical protein